MKQDIDQINVIPLVDVMLVLLVIVLTTATFISTGQIPVNLAKAKTVSDRKDVPIIITLTSEGNLFVNDKPIPDGGLPSTLMAESRESAVVVRADKVTLLEKFVALVDDIRGLGFQQVSLEVIRLP
ncbi:MAG: biopolymer transporter ExbD [Nitrospira sp.]|nr:biopolymer transporter ExbD [Nitrospira sp.]MBH0181103.1 biopolymer transporter ExbD [Nitrospira sp.]MBH0186274.1 biopolymer transporter ExbD [Nitrospira sp.]